MPIIKCPECGREISSYASTCPGCGVPQEIIKKLLVELEKSQIQPEKGKSNVQLEPVAKLGQEVKPAQQAAPQAETVLKKLQSRKIRTIHCVICKNEYMSDGTAVCPQCKYPTLSVIPDKQRTKEEVKAYRKVVGIQDIERKAHLFYKMGRYRGEEINWRVLAVENGKALLISEKVLDAKRYNDERKAVTWENCTLRKWLNNDFYNNAFRSDEREKIRTTKVTADKNPGYSTDPGQDTADKIFLLSIQESEIYFIDDEDREAYPTEYAKANGAYINEEISTECCWRWLRSPCFDRELTAIVSSEGGVASVGFPGFRDGACVRPAMWINLNPQDEAVLQKSESICRNGRGINKSVKVGQFCKMGRYGGEEIYWLVLAVEEGKALLISEKGLDAKSYNDDERENVTWETCTLRKWLNSNFYNSVFGSDEREKILTAKVTADKNPEHDTDPGQDTEDKVFLLSIQEAEKYFTDDGDVEMAAFLTEYAKTNGAYQNDRCCWWWLRSPGNNSRSAVCVGGDGWADYEGNDVGIGDVCVRPALWVKL